MAAFLYTRASKGNMSTELATHAVQQLYQANDIDDKGYQENQGHNTHEDILTDCRGRGYACEKSGSVLQDEPDREYQHKEQQKAHQNALGDMQADLVQAADVIDERKQQ